VTLQIGPHVLSGRLLLAPMAGITDRPFRILCRRFGAALAVSEMSSAQLQLQHTAKSRTRWNHLGEPSPVSVQLVGDDPTELAIAAQALEGRGVDIVDLNMGCPAKKVCRREAGSSLLRDEALVGRILERVVHSVRIPVTLKIRTGYSRAQRNGVTIARLAESAGVAALAVHGRSREDLFNGEAEYDTIAAIKQAVRIPVIANGDIGSAEKAAAVLRHTAADAVMIGRAAFGRPWIFREIAGAWSGRSAVMDPAEERDTVLEHLEGLYDLYGADHGVRIARKHLRWYAQARGGFGAFWAQASRCTEAREQIAAAQAFFASEEVDAHRVAA
jgi:tRNA-dihydrouridine synthase B